jgi:hypothetical protein
MWIGIEASVFAVILIIMRYFAQERRRAESALAGVEA